MIFSNMKKLLLFIFIQIVTFSFVFSQSDNFVPNSSFEEYIICPTNGLGEIYLAAPWTAATGQLATGSSDYINACSSDIYMILTLQVQYPRTGIAYARIILLSAFPDNYREYIGIKMKDSFKKNRKYCTKLYTSLSDFAKQAIENIGIFFSTTEVIQTSLGGPLLCVPQVKNTKGIIKDTINWVKISGSFIASGGEQYLVIGNFDSLINTNYINVGGTGNSHYFIDDVSVCECNDFMPKIGKDTTLCLGQHLLLSANIPKEADSVIYTWQDGSKASTFMVSQPGSYWVSAYIEDYKITVTDSITVNYTDCTVTSPQLWIPNSFTPNNDGLNDNFEYSNSENYIIKTFIYNRWGQLIFEGENTDYWDGTFKGKPVQMEVYNYRIVATDKLSKENKVYSGSITLVQ